MNATNSRLKREDLPHYTYDDYVKWEGKWELIHGIPYAMTPTGTVLHQRICAKIHRQLDIQLDNCPHCEVFWPIDWPITEDTIVQPDVFVVCGIENDDASKIRNTPTLIFEVLSPSTSKKDRGVKYRLYEKAGVKYYCIVDPKCCSIDVFVLRKDKFGKDDTFIDGKIMFDLDPCQLQLDLKEVFFKKEILPYQPAL